MIYDNFFYFLIRLYLKFLCFRIMISKFVVYILIFIRYIFRIFMKELDFRVFNLYIVINNVCKFCFKIKWYLL